MKAALITTAALLALVATPAFAQDEAASSTASTSASASAAAPGNADASGDASGTTVLTTGTVTPESTSTANLAKAVKAAAPRKVFGEFYSETYRPMNEFERGRGNARLDSYAGAKFDLGNSRALSIRQNFDYRSKSEAGVGEFHIQDIQANITQAKAIQYANGAATTIQFRYYAPTGETSRDRGQQGQERLYFITGKSVGKWDLTHVLMGRLNNQSRDYTVKADGTFSQLIQSTVTNELDAFYNINSKLALGMIVGYDNYFFRSTPGQGRRDDMVYLQPTVQVSPIKGLTLQALLYNETSVYKPTQTVRAFRGNETQVSFNVAAAL